MSSKVKVVLTTRSRRNKYLCEEEDDEIDKMLDEAEALFCNKSTEASKENNLKEEISKEQEDNAEARYTYDESDWESTEVSDSEDEGDTQCVAKDEEWDDDGLWQRKRKVTFRTPLTSVREFVQDPNEIEDPNLIIVVRSPDRSVHLGVPRRRRWSSTDIFIPSLPPRPSSSSTDDEDNYSDDDDDDTPPLSSITPPTFNLFGCREKENKEEPKAATAAVVPKGPRSTGLRGSLRSSTATPMITNVLEEGVAKEKKAFDFEKIFKTNRNSAGTSSEDIKIEKSALVQNDDDTPSNETIGGMREASKAETVDRCQTRPQRDVSHACPT